MDKYETLDFLKARMIDQKKFYVDNKEFIFNSWGTLECVTKERNMTIQAASSISFNDLLIRNIKPYNFEFTTKEKEFLNLIDPDQYSFITKDVFGYVFLHEKKPTKNVNGQWENVGETQNLTGILLLSFETLTPDKEPCKFHQYI